MRILTVSRGGIAGAGFAIALTSLGATNAHPMDAGSGRPSAGATVARAISGRRSDERRRNSTTPTACATSYPTFSFIGISGAKEVAGGDEAAVLGGYGNQACDADDGIGGGYLNAIGNSGNADWSSIGGGQSNGITGPNSFVGAGTGNAVSGEESFVGAGTGNIASGNLAFEGSGTTNQASDSYSAVIAGTGNTASGQAAFVGAGEENVASNFASVVAGGDGNTASGGFSIVGAGDDNTASGYYSFSAAGIGNTVSAEASFIGGGLYGLVTGGGSFIGAGDSLYNNACECTTVGNSVSGADSFIGAGDQNTIAANGAFVGSGDLNDVTSAAAYSVVAGGYGNTMSGQKATLGGGEQNDVAGSFATIPGGYRNEALGNESFAAGSQAEARYAGSFVWSDYVSGEKALGDSAAGEFVARASGGVYFFSNAASSTGVHLAAGSGTWSSLSDRNAKTGIVPLDDASILEKVAALPISAWQYKTERGVRHVGPMAQDFYAAFGVGEDDRHITSIDEDGVALAAIKALHSENRQLRRDGERKTAEIAQLRASVATLASKDAVLEKRFDLLSSHLNSDR